MARMVSVFGVATAAFVGFGALAHAKPHDIRVDLTLEVVSAIHMPTGCVSAVEYDDGSFVQAFITDPLCLPKGVEQRSIPATERDFYSLDPQQAAIIGR